MNITIEQLRSFRKILNADDIREIGKIVGCSEGLVRAVLNSTRSNDTVELLCYNKVLDKAQKALIICDKVKQCNKETFRKKKKILTLDLDFTESKDSK